MKLQLIDEVNTFRCFKMELIRVKYSYIPISKHLVMHKYMSLLLTPTLPVSINMPVQ